MLRKLLVSAMLIVPAVAGPTLAEGRGAQQDLSRSFPAARLEQVNRALEEAVAKGLLPGAVILIAQDGEIVHHKALGLLDAAAGTAMPKDAIFRIGSMTKPVVTAAAMVMVEQGRLGLHEPVTRYVPEFAGLRVQTRSTDAAGNAVLGTAPPARPISIHDLMRHTSGFTYSFTGPATDPIRKAYLDQGIEQIEADLPADEMIRRLAGIPLAHEPGTTFEYGVSTDVLGIVLERISGKRLDAVLDETIFRPLGMRDSGFTVKPADRARLARFSDADPLSAWLSGWLRVEADRPQGYLSGGGGMVSTVPDYFRFAQMILDRGTFRGVRVLSRKSVELMLSDHLAGLSGGPTAYTGPGYGFGLGFAVRAQDGVSPVLGSKGDATWFGVTGTTFVIDPQEMLVAILMAQAPSGRGQMRPLFRNLVYGAMAE